MEPLQFVIQNERCKPQQVLQPVDQIYETNETANIQEIRSQTPRQCIIEPKITDVTKPTRRKRKVKTQQPPKDVCYIITNYNSFLYP